MSRTEDAERPAPRRRELPSAAETPAAVATDDRSSAVPGGPRGEPSEARLRGLGVPAVLVGRDHRIRAANRRCVALFAGERLTGRRCYEVFHGRRTACAPAHGRCPVRRLQETGEPCRVVHVHQTARGAEHHDVAVYPFAGGGAECSCLELRPIAVASARPRRSGLVGRSEAFNRMLELVLRAAPRRTPVLLLGETGTGREEVARALHQLGRSPRRAFACVQCAGLAGERFAGELLGRAAAGPGVAGEPGKIAAARGGTLFLADVGVLAPLEQGELLRLLKTGSLCRAARAESPALGFRLVCSAGPCLREKVARGDFLADLYYRISAFPIELPPLRQRREDLPLLVDSELEALGYPDVEIHPRTLAVLERHPLLGNLRELRRILEYACLHASGGVILPDHVPPECRLARPELVDLDVVANVATRSAGVDDPGGS